MERKSHLVPAKENTHRTDTQNIAHRTWHTTNHAFTQADEAGCAARSTLREVEEELSGLAREVARRQRDSKDLAEKLAREQMRCQALSESLAETQAIGRYVELFLK
jgi:chromosome segregation ATPase